METKADFVLFSWALKSLWPVTTVMKLEDASSLEEKLWLTYLLFSCSVVSDSVTPWTTAHQTPLSYTVSRTLLKLMSIESMMPSNHFILCLPLLLLPSIFPSISIFSNESAFHIRWPKYWSFNFSISPSNEYSLLFHQICSQKTTKKSSMNIL